MQQIKRREEKNLIMLITSNEIELTAIAHKFSCNGLILGILVSALFGYPRYLN